MKAQQTRVLTGRRTAVILLGAVGLSLVSSWTIALLSTEYQTLSPGMARMRDALNDHTNQRFGVWGFTNHRYFDGAAGNDRKWLGTEYQYVQPFRSRFFARDFDYEHPDLTPPPEALVSHREAKEMLPAWSRARIPPTGDESDGFVCFEIESGWPWLAFQGACVVDHAKHVARGASAQQLGFRYPAVESIHWAIPIRISNSSWGLGIGRSVDMLPLRPIFPGVIYNTLFWGLILILLMLTRDALRWRKLQRRLANGRCTRCNYTLAGADPCPECGTPVKQLKPSISNA